MSEQQNTWKVPALAVLNEDGSVNLSVHAWSVGQTIGVPSSNVSENAMQELRKVPGKTVVLEAEVNLGAEEIGDVVHAVLPLPEHLAAHAGVIDSVTGLVCEGCFGADQRGEDLDFFGSAQTYDVSSEVDSSGYFDCLNCNDVSIAGHPTTAYFRP